MEAFSIRYDDKAVRDRINKIIQRTGDATPAMQEIGEYMLQATDERFQTETDPSGEPWQPLSPFTLAQKKALGRINKILQSTGDMRNRTTYQATKDSCTIGNNSSKAPKHQFGVGVPVREFLGVSEDDRLEIIEILQSYLLG